jgi:putative PIN family toxin of toxin-antitoxin system
VRLVVDTNILISALLGTTGLPAHLIDLWRDGRFALLTAPEQVDELRRVTRYPKIRERLPPALAGRLVNDLRALAILVGDLPRITASSDADDNLLLAIAVAGSADFLITGDKRYLLSLGSHGGTKILTVRSFLELQRQVPKSGATA